ncbi:MAG TPA: hypothetical protein VHC97_07905 [Thermoanaerobaculia bacterium]|jgi:hypothetical protein|nr:hypothetical protein [Thermoanaerobaculia bacterium]
MDSEEFARQVQALADEMSAATARWEARAKKLERDLDRAQRKLQQIRVEHKKRLDDLWASYANGGPSPTPPPSQETQKGRRRRKSMDAQILQLIREQFHDGDFTVHDVIASWNARHPMDTLSTSTIRGILNRHASDGRLREVEKGGRGNGNLERFALETDAEGSASSGGNAVELAH